MKLIKFFILTLIFLAGCGGTERNNEQFLVEYIKAANAHDIEKVQSMYSDSITWYLGHFTLKGKDEAIAPIRFDKGANTILEADNILVNGDTLDFNLQERNDVLTALGVNELHHYPRFILQDGFIRTKLSRKPPDENRAFADSITAFANWLSVNSPETYNKFWPDGKFDFSEEVGKEMPIEIKKWRERNR